MKNQAVFTKQTLPKYGKNYLCLELCFYEQTRQQHYRWHHVFMKFFKEPAMPFTFGL